MRTKVISIKVSPEESSAIQAEAERANLSQSELIRQMTLGGPIMVVDKAPEICAGLCRLEQELARCGQQNNKNVRRELDALWLCLKR